MASLIAPEKRRRARRVGFFFPVKGDVPSSYRRDYEAAVASDAMAYLRQAHLAQSFDIIDAHDGIALVAAAAIASEFKVPIIHTIHSHEVIERLAKDPSPQLIDALGSCTQFIAVSRYIADAHAPFLKQTVDVIRNPVPRGLARRGESNATPVKVLYVGRVEALKGFNILLDALEYLPHGERLAITVLGAVEEPELQQRARGIGVSIRFCGVVDATEVYRAFGDHDLFVFPTRMEACSMALLEAMGAGMAVLASDIPPNREVGADAIAYHHDGDARSLASELDRLLDDTQAIGALGSAAYRRAGTFAPSRVFADLKQSYSKAVQSHRAALANERCN